MTAIFARQVMNMKVLNKKRIFIILGALLVLVLALVFGRLAFFNSVDSATNTIIAGSVHILLREPDYPGNSDPAASNLVPLGEVPKNPMITNVGLNDAFVFLRVAVPTPTVRIADKTGAHGQAYAQEIFYLKTNDLSSDDLQTNFNTADWVELTEFEEGIAAGQYVSNYRTYVFAYQKSIRPGEATSALFDKIQLRNIIELPASDSDYNINIEALAIQSDNLSITSKKTDLTADELSEIYQLID